jgi:hypothetical protein
MQHLVFFHVDVHNLLYFKTVLAVYVFHNIFTPKIVAEWGTGKRSGVGK